MTNKEFIQKLKSEPINYCKECNLKGCDNCEKERNAQFNRVIKDLDVLEILKKYIGLHIGVSNTPFITLNFGVGCEMISEEEYQKIKEWLKYEK